MVKTQFVICLCIRSDENLFTSKSSSPVLLWLLSYDEDENEESVKTCLPVLIFIPRVIFSSSSYFSLQVLHLDVLLWSGM